MQRVLDNLVSNALKFTLPKGRGTLRLEYPVESWARIQVFDEGPGVWPPGKEREYLINLKWPL